MAKAICELLWIKNLMQELQVEQTSPMRLYFDSKAACDIAHNPVQHDRTKHVEVDRHFIKEKFKNYRSSSYSITGSACRCADEGSIQPSFSYQS
jgi:hypothetical protein